MKISFEVEDCVLRNMLEQILSVGDSDTDGSTRKPPVDEDNEDNEDNDSGDTDGSTRKPPTDEDVKLSDLKKLANKIVKLSSKQDVAKILRSLYKTTSLTKIDESDYSECKDALDKRLEELSEQDDVNSDDDNTECEQVTKDSDITPEAIVTAFKALEKEYGEDEAKGLMKDFGLEYSTRPRLLKKEFEQLEGDELENFYKELVQ